MRPVVAAVHTGRVLSKICLKFNMDGLVTFIVKSVNSYTPIQYFWFFSENSCQYCEFRAGTGLKRKAWIFEKITDFLKFYAAVSISQKFL